jgi:cell division protein FtsZ
MLIKPQTQNLSAKIIICGVGGAGCNAVEAMIQSGEVGGVEFIAINTDSQVLEHSSAATRITIGKDLTKGLGAGGNPQVGRQAAEDSVEYLNEALAGSDMVFVTSGMGGGTGTGASPIIAGIAKGLGALTVGVVTKPFVFEGGRKMEVAMKGIEDLRNKVDALIVIPNQRILEIIDRNVSFKQAMQKSDEILKNAIQSISDIITQTGQINVDFADVKAIMQDAGTALMGIGNSSNKDTRAIDAAKMAIHSPILDYSIDGAKGVLVTIRASNQVSMIEISEAIEVIRGYVDQNALIKMGVLIDENAGEAVSVTVLATGFDVDPIEREIQQRKLADERRKNEQSNPQNRSSIPLNSSSSNMSQKPMSSPKPSNPQPKSNDDDDGDLDTPAFMRRRIGL